MTTIPYGAVSTHPAYVRWKIYAAPLLTPPVASSPYVPTNARTPSLEIEHDPPKYASASLSDGTNLASSDQLVPDRVNTYAAPESAPPVASSYAAPTIARVPSLEIEHDSPKYAPTSLSDGTNLASSDQIVPDRVNTYAAPESAPPVASSKRAPTIARVPSLVIEQETPNCAFASLSFGTILPAANG